MKKNNQCRENDSHAPQVALVCRAVVLMVVDNVSEAERLHQLENQLDKEANGDTEEATMEAHRIGLEEGATSVCLEALPGCSRRSLSVLLSFEDGIGIRESLSLQFASNTTKRRANKRRAWLKN
jgi:hypothetical protein